MQKITLHAADEPRTTTISNIFIDIFMPSANGSYVKVYLYLVRCLSMRESNLSITFLADCLDNTENDIIRALKYWEKVNLLSLEKDEQDNITGITLHEPSISDTHTYTATEDTVAENNDAKYVIQSETPEEPTVRSLPPRPSYSAAELDMLTNDETVKWLMNIIEIYLERPLKPKDIELILYLYDTIGFSTDLIMHLYEYCISKNKKNTSYIETVALSWAEQGISNVEEAEEASSAYNNNYVAVMRTFGLNRLPGAVEKQYIDKWANSYHLSLDVIEEACSRTLLNTQKADFKYADKILSNWKKEGISNLQDIAESDKEFMAKKAARSYSEKDMPKKPASNRFNTFPQRNYTKEEYATIEQKLLHIKK